MLNALIEGLLKAGAPWGLFCAILIFAVGTLWRRSVLLADKLYDLAVAQVKKDTEVHGTLTNTLRELEELRRSLK